MACIFISTWFHHSRLVFPIVNWHDRETYPSLAEARTSDVIKTSEVSPVFCGGVSQHTIVYADASKVREEAADAIRQTGGRRLLLGTGCVVPVIAPHGNILAARQSVEAHPMSLRVISGTAKGRKLKDVPGDTTRPVTDMVKEALFNILAGDVLDSVWWDLFAGTGAIGIEALSRGASFVRFSDLNRLPIDTIQANLQNTGFSSQAEIRRGDAFSMLEAAPARPIRLCLHCPAAIQGNGF